MRMATRMTAQMTFPRSWLDDVKQRVWFCTQWTQDAGAFKSHRFIKIQHFTVHTVALGPFGIAQRWKNEKKKRKIHIGGSIMPAQKWLDSFGRLATVLRSFVRFFFSSSFPYFSFSFIKMKTRETNRQSVEFPHWQFINLLKTILKNTEHVTNDALPFVSQWHERENK